MHDVIQLDNVIHIHYIAALSATGDTIMTKASVFATSVT